MTNSLKQTFKKTIAILDGTPTGTRGQSLMELSITFPIFMILLLGLVEIGWLANNYLTIVDVSREAGRYGSIRDPLLWEPGTERNYERMDCDNDQGYFNKFGDTQVPPVTDRTSIIGNLPGYTDGVDGDIAYYDGVACAVIINMAPLEFNDDVDDIVVSVISYVVIEQSGTRSISIVGRYPAQSNECSDDGRDPFAPPWLPAGERDPIRYDASTDGQRGYMFRGNHEVQPGCLGSEFDINEIENLLNRTLVNDSGGSITQEELEGLPNNSIVMVEIFWENEQLLNLPFFTWIGNPLPLHVWSFFPVTASEPTATPAP